MAHFHHTFVLYFSIDGPVWLLIEQKNALALFPVSCSTVQFINMYFIISLLLQTVGHIIKTTYTEKEFI